MYFIISFLLNYSWSILFVHWFNKVSNSAYKQNVKRQTRWSEKRKKKSCAQGVLSKRKVGVVNNKKSTKDRLSETDCWGTARWLARLSCLICCHGSGSAPTCLHSKKKPPLASVVAHKCIYPTVRLESKQCTLESWNNFSTNFFSSR